MFRVLEGSEQAHNICIWCLRVLSFHSSDSGFYLTETKQIFQKSSGFAESDMTLLVYDEPFL